MYSGTTFRKNSGGFVGVHQKIDRVARRKFADICDDQFFPSIKEILHFEGNHGPDGIKRKSPAVDEPWHYIDPTDETDKQLIGLINDHIDNLAKALKDNDQTRAAFEAAWLAHAVTDGLTPAHHYPLGDKIEELWGKPKEQRLSIIDKNFIRGSSRRDTMSKNWEYWGAKGIFSTHLLFELGVAASAKTHRFTRLTIDESLLNMVKRDGFEPVFKRAVNRIYDLGMYEDFWKKGWSTRLALQTRKQLMPDIIETVTLAWYAASVKAKKI